MVHLRPRKREVIRTMRIVLSMSEFRASDVDKKTDSFESSKTSLVAFTDFFSGFAFLSKSARQAKFKGVFDVVCDEVLEKCKADGLPQKAVEWYRANLVYNVPHGKLTRGLSIIDSVELLKGRTLTEDEFRHAAILGWCVELLQGYYLIYDDVMDASITRRSQACWYRAPVPNVDIGSRPSDGSATVPFVGMKAINDGAMLNSAIFNLLRMYFSTHPRYADLVYAFLDVTFKSAMGQLIDLLTATEGDVDLSRFSFDRHRFISIYKTSYYTFLLPVLLAMLMCDIPETYAIQSEGSTTDFKPYDLARSVLLPLGDYYQAQDDFLDFSAPPETLGKIGTDIVDNKCSWCINTALSVCTPEQRVILDRNYGRKGDLEAGAEGADEDEQRAKARGPTGSEAGGLCEKRVKEVFEAINLRQIYAEYEDSTYKRLNALTDSIPHGVILDADGRQAEHQGFDGEVFRIFLEKIYRRSK
ncbi:hypothetical protein H0H92_006415 [Tricholoma furcatifolium]|nr:hypothetical protein H0H92_006415 [Tricholoma furcatifolium]